MCDGIGQDNTRTCPKPISNFKKYLKPVYLNFKSVPLRLGQGEYSKKHVSLPSLTIISIATYHI